MRRTHASNKEEKKTVTAFKTRIDFSIAYTSHKCYVIFCRDLVKNLKLMRICDVIHYYCSINICRTKQWANMESWLKCSSFVIFVSNSTLSQFGIEYTPDLSYQRVIEFLKKNLIKVLTRLQRTERYRNNRTFACVFSSFLLLFFDKI